MIKGNLINLRVIEERDLEELLKLENDISTVGDYADQFIMTPVDFRKRFFEHGFWQPDSGRMLITDKKDNILGRIQHFRSYKYSTGYELGSRVFLPENRSKGYVSEAIRLYTSYLFQSRRVDRIELSTEPGNLGAQKVALKAGFIYEGTRRSACITRGKLVDLRMYSLLRSDLKED